LVVNPARGVRLPRIEDEEARFLSPAELLALEHAMPQQWAVLVPFLADVGLRIGEAAGLRWRDVDTWQGIVTVRQVLFEVRGQITMGPPKTRAGRRAVPTLTREIAQRLELVRGARDEFVFRSRSGGPLRPGSFRRRVWHPAVEAAELTAPVPTPHSLRHTAVAHWIAAGVEPYKLAKWAGHRSVATIYRVYGHLLDTGATDEREALSAMRAAAIAQLEASGEVVDLAARRR
jgi:integrase